MNPDWSFCRISTAKGHNSTAETMNWVSRYSCCSVQMTSSSDAVRLPALHNARAPEIVLPEIQDYQWLCFFTGSDMTCLALRESFMLNVKYITSGGETDLSISISTIF